MSGMRISGIILFAFLGMPTTSVGVFAQTPENQPPAATTVPPPPPAESLPRPDFHFKGQVGRTYQDSDPPTFPRSCVLPKAHPTSFSFCSMT